MDLEGIARVNELDEKIHNLVESFSTDLNPAWLHPPFETREDVERVLYRARDAILDADAAAASSPPPESESPGFEDEVQPSLGNRILFLVEGRFTRGDTDAQPSEDDDDLPAGSFWYNVYQMRDDLPANLMAPPDTVIKMDRVEGGEDGVLTFAGNQYDNIRDLVSFYFFSNRTRYIPVFEPRLKATLADRQRRIVALEAERDALIRTTRVYVSLTIVRGDANNTPVGIEYCEVPPDQGEYSPFLTDWLGTIPVDAYGSTIEEPEEARVLYYDGNTSGTVANAVRLYDFRDRIFRAPLYPPILVVIERDFVRARVEDDAEQERRRERKRPRKNAAVYALGQSIAKGKSVVVAILSDMEGLAICDRDTMEPVCDHVHALDIAALSGKQVETGRPCPKCNE